MQDTSKVNVKLVLEYDGKNYSGWQKQKSKQTVQETVENALRKLFPGEVINLIGAGRTDTGVHALAQTANFKIKREKLKRYGLNRFIESLNSILPGDIAVLNAKKAVLNFHSRYSARKRIYCYFFSMRKHAIGGDKELYISSDFDINKANEFCNVITGCHSFEYFCKNKTDKHDFKSLVDYACVKKIKGGRFVFEICANRFMHSMVRALAGVLIKVASGKLTIEKFKQLFLNREPIKIQYVPAKALFLKKVIY